MSIERDVTGTNKTITAEEKEQSTQEALAIARDARDNVQDEFMSLSDDDLIRRIVEIADRGMVSLRLRVDMPSDWHGEWIADDPQSIAEAKMKGFIIDDRFAPKDTLHSDGSGKPIVGDVIHMICPKRIKDAHDAAMKIRYQRAHGKRKNLTEENNYEASVKELGLDLSFKGAPINNSSMDVVPGSQIKNSIKGS